MYPRNAATPPRIAIGAVVQISDGAVQTSGVSVVVRAEGGSETAGGGTVSYGASSGIVYYAPTQAETNYTAFVVAAYKTGCIPVSQTVVTTANATAGRVDVGSVGGTSQTARDLGASVLLSPGTGTGQISLTSGAVTAGTVSDKTGYSLTATTGLGNQTANITGNLSGSVGSVTGEVSADVTKISGSATAADNLEASALGIISGTAATGTLSTTVMTSDLSGYADDELIGRVVVWTGGTAAGQASAITDYASTSGTVTYDAITTAPDNGDTFVIV